MSVIDYKYVKTVDVEQQSWKPLVQSETDVRNLKLLVKDERLEGQA